MQQPERPRPFKVGVPTLWTEQSLPECAWHSETDSGPVSVVPRAQNLCSDAPKSDRPHHVLSDPKTNGGVIVR